MITSLFSDNVVLWRKTLRRVVGVVVVVRHGVIISLPPVSDQLWSGSTLAQPGRISLKDAISWRDCWDVLLADMLEYERPVNDDKYCATLKTLKKALRRNAPAFLAVV
jgi:hypothetical protein